MNELYNVFQSIDDSYIDVIHAFRGNFQQVFFYHRIEITFFIYMA